MSLTNTFYTRAHPDVELGYRRSILEYELTFPAAGIDEETGLIMFITPFGDSPKSVYQSEKLRPYLANNHNCIVAGVNYFGMDRTKGSIAFDDHFFGTLQALYDIPFTDFLNPDGSLKNECIQILAAHLKHRGIKYLSDSSAPLFRMAYHLQGEYQSFGFLPALDYLVVLGDILKKHQINKRKIIAYGSSYGGYVGLLLGKFAPHTFSVIVDNSGYSRASIYNICTTELKAQEVIYKDEHVHISGIPEEPWTLKNESDPNYFSDSHRAIRSLLEVNHRISSDTSYYIFHGDNDTVCPTSEKEQAVEILRKYNPVHFKKVMESDLDGVVFKSMKHGMNASLRGIFDHVQMTDRKNLLKDTPTTDFDQENVHDFECGNKTYRFSYSADNRVQVNIL